MRCVCKQNLYFNLHVGICFKSNATNANVHNYKKIDIEFQLTRLLKKYNL